MSELEHDAQSSRRYKENWDDAVRLLNDKDEVIAELREQLDRRTPAPDQPAMVDADIEFIQRAADIVRRNRPDLVAQVASETQAQAEPVADVALSNLIALWNEGVCEGNDVGELVDLLLKERRLYAQPQRAAVPSEIIIALARQTLDKWTIAQGMITATVDVELIDFARAIERELLAAAPESNKEPYRFENGDTFKGKSS
jgi:hypothetical protein